MRFLLEQPKVLSRRAQYENELRKNNGTTNSSSQSRGNLDNLCQGSTATAFLQQFRTEQECTWKKISRMLVWDHRMKALIYRKHDKFRYHQKESPRKYVLKCWRECTSREVWAGSMVQRLDVQDAPRLAVLTKPVTRMHAGTRCAQNLKRVKKQRVSCQRTSTCECKETRTTLFIKPQLCCVRGMGSPTREILAIG